MSLDDFMSEAECKMEHKCFSGMYYDVLGEGQAARLEICKVRNA